MIRRGRAKRGKAHRPGLSNGESDVRTCPRPAGVAFRTKLGRARADMFRIPQVGKFLPANTTFITETAPASPVKFLQLAQFIDLECGVHWLPTERHFDNLDSARSINMRRVFRLSAFLVIVSALAFAETFSGKLIDAACADQQKSEACAPTASTSAFAINASGKVLKLDAAGNTKAAEAMKNRENSADRSKSPNREITATVQGTLSEDTIKVDSIEVR